MPLTHGGARLGAGRKSKEAPFSDRTSEIEQIIVDALPAIVNKLIEMAMNGDLKAGRYLIDRILGRAPRLSSPPAGASHSEPREQKDRPHLSDATTPSTSTKMTLDELREAAFGSKPVSTLEIIKRDLATETRKQPNGDKRLTFASAGHT